MIELMLPGNKISGGNRGPIPRLLQHRQLLLIHLVFGNDPADESSIVFQIVRGGEPLQIMPIPGHRRVALGRNPARVDSFDGGFRDTVTVLPNVILNAGSVFSDMVRPDDAAILQMDDFRPGTNRRKHRYTSTYEQDDRWPH